MKGVCRITGEHKSVPVAVVKAKVVGGDLVVSDGIVIEVNQSNCINFDEKVMGTLNITLNYKEGDELDLRWDCIKEPCEYPFCKCKGSDRVMRDDIKDKRTKQKPSYENTTKRDRDKN